MTEKLDIVLVNPGNHSQVYGKLGSSLSGLEPPLWTALIAAFVLKHGYSVKIIDAEAENLSPEDTAERIAGYSPLLAGIIVLGSNPSASSTPKMAAAGGIAAALKNRAPNIKIVFSGLHPSALPELTLREEKADFVCQGEGFHTFVELLDVVRQGKEPFNYNIPGLWYRQNGNILSNPPAPLIDVDELPLAAWGLLPMEKYRAHNWHCFDNIEGRQPYAVIYTSLGCPFSCSYCNVKAIYNDKAGIRFRSPEKVLQEIDFLVKNYRVRNIKILDELFVLKEDQVISICDLIARGGYDLNMWAYARVDTIREIMLKKMKRAGINWVAYGIESASERVRKGVAKKLRQDMIRKAVEMTHAAGISIIGNFIFGLPDDDLESMQETLEMAKVLNLEYVNFYTAMAYPGSQLFCDSVKQGIKLPENWQGYGQYSFETLPLPTRYLSAAEVLRFRDRAFKEYFSDPKYLAMISEKFGQKVVEHIVAMLKHEIRRKFV